MPLVTARKKPVRSARDARIFSHRALPRILAARAARRAPASVDLDDLVAAGTEGLIQAAQRFDEAAGVPFASFAQRRVQGAILDVLRAEDHLSRAGRRRARLEEHLPPSAARVALDDAPQIAGDARDCPLEAALRSEAHESLAAAIATLPARSQQILSLYYEEELTLREIGQVFQVTESRVCQLLRGAHEALREQLSPARAAPEGRWASPQVSPRRADGAA